MKLKSIASFSLGPLLAALLGLATVPALAWLFPPEEMGRLDLLLLAFSFLGLGLSFGLDKAFVLEYYRCDDRAKLLKACMLPGLLVFPALILLTWMLASPISRILFGVDRPVWSVLIVLGTAGALLNRFLAQLLRLQERGWAFSLSQVLPKVVLLLVLPLLWLHDSRGFTPLAVVTVASGWLVAGGLLWWSRNFIREVVSSRVAWCDIQPLMRLGLPLAVSGLFYLAMHSTGVWLLRFFSGFDELGFYSMAMRVAAAASIVQSIFTIVWMPIVLKWAVQGEDMSQVDQVAGHVLAIVVFGFCAAGMTVWLMGWMLPDDYQAASYLVVAAVGQPLLYALSEVTCVGISLSRKTHLAVLAAAAGFIANLGVSSLLVPQLGAKGAVVGLLFGFFIFFVVRTELSARVWRSFPRRRLYGSTAVLSILAATSALIGDRLGSWVPCAWAGLFLVSLWWFRLEIAGLWVGLLFAARGREGG